MNTQSRIAIFIFILISNISIVGQAVEEEIGFKYVKGNYLFDSGRFDEAVQIYNDIVKTDPAFKDVLVYRANAKYALGAYKGAKKDGLDYIQLNGLTENVCLLLGKAEMGLGNPLVAISYLDYAILKNEDNVDALLFRGNAFFELEDDVSACTDWHKAIRRGSDSANRQASKYCQRIAIPIEDTRREQPEDVEILNEGNAETEIDSAEILSSEQNDDIVKDDENSFPSMEEVIMLGSDSTQIADPSSEVIIPEIVREPIDDSVQIIEIDEDLDLKIYGGVGNRELRDVPEILILSDTEGQVVVDICIDKSGNVIGATMNRDESTIGSAGLISLALRKSRDFRFDRSRNAEQCGKIAFLIR